MHMDIHKFLLAFGLTDTESTLYIALLSETHMSANELASVSALKRPRIYHALETLQEKGLVREIGSTRIKRYAAEPPAQLQTILKRREIVLQSLEKKLTKTLPHFPDVGTNMPGAVGTEYFYGKEGLLNLADRVFSSKTKTLLALNPPFKTMTPLFDSDYGIFYLQKRADSEIHTKTIWQDIPKQDKRMVDHKTLKREMRIASVEKFGEFKSTIMVFDNSVAIINYLPEVSGMLITSFSYAETMRLMWQQVWNQAESVD